jgi:hypothetical protein
MTTVDLVPVEEQSSRHTPCAVAGGRHTECACYFQNTVLFLVRYLILGLSSSALDVPLAVAGVVLVFEAAADGAGFALRVFAADLE